MNREPLVTTASVTALVAALIGLLVAFNVPLSDDQQKAILAVTAIVAPIVVGLVARGRVTPNGSVAVARDPASGDLVAAPALPYLADGTPVDVDVAAA